MKFDLAHILAVFVLLFFVILEMLCTVFIAATRLLSYISSIVSSARNLLSPADGYPLRGASQSQPRIKKGRRAGMIGRITSLFTFFAAGNANCRPSFVTCLAWVSLPILQCIWFLAITITKLAGSCFNKVKEWDPLNYFAVLRQLKAAQREARLLEEGLYQTTVEIRNLKALYKVKEKENLDLGQRVEEVEEDRTMVVEDLNARLKERTKQEETFEEEKQALVEQMAILRKEKDVEVEMLEMEKEAEIIAVKEEHRVVEEKYAEQIAALRKENETPREEKATVEKENEFLKEENTKIQKRIEELQVEVKVAQDKAKVASSLVNGMEIAQNEERKKRMETESTVIILREELNATKQDLDQEKMGREAERVAMELERSAFEEDIRKSQEEHRQEVNAFVGQLQGAWNRALDLNGQLDIANQQNSVLQVQLKEAQDSLAMITGEKEKMGLENQNLQEEVARLREEVAGAMQRKEVDEKERCVGKDVVATDLGIDLEKLKKNFESRDRVRRDTPRIDETTVAEDSSSMDGEDTVLDITTNRFDTPGCKKQPSAENEVNHPTDALLVATKDNLVIGSDIPVVRLPAAGTTRVLPRIQGGSVDAYVPPVEAASMVPLSFDPALIKVRLPTASQPPIGKDTRSDSRSSRPVKLKEAASLHPKKQKRRRGRGREQGDAKNDCFNQTDRRPLGSITNQSSNKHPAKGTRRWGLD